MNIVLVVLSIGVIYFLAHAFASIFARTKIPDVLWLMLIGLALGPFSGLVNPASLGQLGTIFVTITLIVVLFQSGTGITFKTLLKASSSGLALTTINFVATTVITGVIILLVSQLTVSAAFMVGAVVGGTSSAVVIPLLRQLKMRDESCAILLLESALTDVLCIVVTLAFLGLYKEGSVDLGHTIGGILSSFIVSAVLGIVGAFLWSLLLSKMRTLQDSIFATMAFVLLVFGAAEYLGFSGYIAALAFGVSLGNIEALTVNMKEVKVFSLSLHPVGINEIEKRFFSEIVFVVKTAFFLYVGLSIQITNAGWMYIGLIITMAAFVLRVPVVRISISKSTPAADATLMAVMVPKGLAAAALASLPLQQGIPGGDMIQNVVFAVVMFSIVLTSILIFLVHNTPVSKVYRRFFSGFGLPAADEASRGGK